MCLYWHALEVERTGQLIGKGFTGLMVVGSLIANALACFESQTPPPELKRRVHGAKLMVGWMVGWQVGIHPYHGSWALPGEMTAVFRRLPIAHTHRA